MTYEQMGMTFRVRELASAGLGLVIAAGCGSSGNTSAGEPPRPAATIAGVGVATVGPVPKPARLGACVERWNASPNAGARRDARRRAPRARRAIVAVATKSGYFSDLRGRCLIYLIPSDPGAAIVFVERSPEHFIFTADASGRLSPPNATLGTGHLLRLS